jgi:hypothetical protein
MKLFEYLKAVFGSDAQWAKLTSYDKSKNSFMLNRMLSARFPTQANMFNKLKTDPVGTAECWRLVGAKFSRVPGFIYTKVSKKSVKKQWDPDQTVVSEYLKINQIGMREFTEALEFNPEVVKKSIDILQKQMGYDTD